MVRMNHIKPKKVKVFNDDNSVCVLLPFQILVENGYSEEDLNHRGELWLDRKYFLGLTFANNTQRSKSCR